MAKLARSTDEGTEAMKKIADIAALAGLKGQVEDDRFIVGFNLSGGRSQLVHVKYLGTGPGDRPAVMFFSPARVIQKGFFKGLPQKQALELLKLNQAMMFARFGIMETADKMLVVASMDALLDSMDAEEFETAAQCVALAADRYEQEYGGDDF